MTVLIVLGAVSSFLAALGGAGALLSALTNRKTAERSTVVSEFHEVNATRSELIDELQQMRQVDRERADRQIAEVRAEMQERLEDVERRLDRCEEEKAQMREERQELLRMIRGGGQ